MSRNERLLAIGAGVLLVAALFAGASLFNASSGPADAQIHGGTPTNGSGPAAPSDDGPGNATQNATGGSGNETSDGTGGTTGTGGSGPQTDAAPTLDVSASQLDFGRVRVGRTETKQVTVGNAGNATLLVSNLTVGGPDASAFSLENASAPFTLAPGANLTVTVVFAPGSASTVTGALNVTSNDTAAPHVTVWLDGRGTRHHRSSGTGSTTSGGSDTTGTSDTGSSDTGTAGNNTSGNSTSWNGTSGNSTSGDGSTVNGTSGNSTSGDGSAGSCTF